MAHPGPIDILSSDSESEIEVCVENGTSLAMESAVTRIPRKLPSWASTASTQSNGYIGSSRNHQLPQRASSSVEWHSNHNHSSQVKLQKHPSSTYRDHMTFADRPVNDFHVEDVDGSVSSHHKDISGNIFGKFSSQQYLKRCLPQSLQSPASTSKAKSSMENGALSKSYLPFASNIIDPKVYPKDNLGGKANDVSSKYDHTGGRLLPSSLAHGKLLPNVQSDGSSAPAHLSRIEERPAENDERLVFQAALQIAMRQILNKGKRHMHLYVKPSKQNIRTFVAPKIGSIFNRPLGFPEFIVDTLAAIEQNRLRYYIFIQYYREHEVDNMDVVLYNPYIFKMIDCAGIRCVKYIDKYIFKRHDKTTMVLNLASIGSRSRI